MIHQDLLSLFLIALVGLYAGTQNVLAGGGSFITLPSLILMGLNPLAANMTSCVALFPNQITSALAARDLLSDVGPVRFRHLFFVSCVGGAIGAWLLIVTPVKLFTHLVPWLVLFATAAFAWGSFRRKPLHTAKSMPPFVLMSIQAAIAIYGGYFGGGIGFLMLTALTLAGLTIRPAVANKNFLAMAMNATAVLIFAFSDQVFWPAVLALGAGGVGGGFLGVWLMKWVPDKLLRGFVILVGVALAVWLFVR